MKAAFLFLLFIMLAFSAMAFSGCNFLFSKDEKTSISASGGHVWESNIGFDAATNLNIKPRDVFRVVISAEGERGFRVEFECLAVDAGRRFGATGTGENDLSIACKGLSAQRDFPNLYLFLPNRGDPLSKFILIYSRANIANVDFEIRRDDESPYEFLAVNTDYGLKFAMALAPVDNRSPLRPFYSTDDYRMGDIMNLNIEIDRGS